MAISAINNAIQGLQTANNGLVRNASDIARAGTTQPTLDPVQPLVESRLNLTQAQASAEVIGTTNRVIGTLLDVTA